MQNIITIKNLNYVTKNRKHLLNNVNLDISKNDCLAVLGANGAGKSTLIKCILGLKNTENGQIAIAKNIKIGYVPQNYQYSCNVSFNGIDVIKSGLLSNKNFFLPINYKKLINNVVSMIGVENFCKQKFSTLSGGEQQKIVIARALVSNPDVLILDEPTTGVDKKSEKEFINILQKLKNNNKTIIMVLHDFEPFCKIINKAIVLKGGSIIYKTSKLDKTLNSIIFNSKHTHH